ncbi:MAG: hypothetical protein ACRC2V_01880 [Xenococcaceae cyanobacterium]
MLKASVEAGDETWTGEAGKGILEEIDQTIEFGSSLCYDPVTKLVIGVKHELFHTSDQYEIPSFSVGDSIAHVTFSTTEWKAIMKFGAIAKERVYVQITGNIFSLSAISRDGLIASQTIILDNSIKDGESIDFSIPSSAIFDAESASIEIGSEKILIESSDFASIWAIDPDESPFYPGLIPEGTVEISVSRKELKPLLGKGAKLKINISKKGDVQIKSSTTTARITIQTGTPVDVPPSTSLQIAAEAIESAIRLIGTAKLITLTLPVGLQYIPVSAAAVRCLVPTIVSAAKALTAKQIVASEPLVLETETTTIEVEDGSEVTMTIETVEKLDIPESSEPTSRQEAIAQLESATEAAKEAIARIPVGSELEVAKQAIEETLLTEAQSLLSTEKTQSVFSKEDQKNYKRDRKSDRPH